LEHKAIADIMSLKTTCYLLVYKNYVIRW